MKKKDLVKTLKVKGLVNLCRMYKITTGTKQCMIDNLLKHLGKIPKQVIIEVGLSNQQGGGGGGDKERRALIELLVMGKVPNIGNQIMEIKSEMQRSNAEIHQFNQVAILDMERDENALNALYSKLLQGYESIEENIDKLYVPPNDVGIVAIRHGILGDEFMPKSNRVNNTTQVNGGGSDLLDRLKNYMRRFLKPIFKIPTKKYSHEEFITILHKYEKSQHNWVDFQTSVNFDLYNEGKQDVVPGVKYTYDSFLQPQITKDPKHHPISLLNSTHKTPTLNSVPSMVTFDEHPYKHLYFEEFVAKAPEAEYNASQYIQVFFKDEHILVRKQTPEELQNVINSFFENKDYNNAFLKSHHQRISELNSKQKELFYIYLKQHILFYPTRVMFRFDACIWDVLSEKLDVIRDMKSDLDIVRFRQHKYKLCWMCSALNMMYIYEKEQQVEFKDVEFKDIWEDTKRTYHILDVARYYFFKKETLFDAEALLKGNWPYNMWNLMISSSFPERRAKVTGRSHLEENILDLTDPMFEKYGFLEYYSHTSNHAVCTYKPQGHVRIYDSERDATMELSEYLATKMGIYMYFLYPIQKLVPVTPIVYVTPLKQNVWKPV